MPRLPLTLLACLVLAAGGALAGCGDDGDDSSGSSSPPPAAAPPPPPPPPPASAASGDEVKVTMKNLKYMPETIQVTLGQKIVWENTDGDIPHTVTASEGADFDSGNLTAGDTFEYTPKKAGTIAYFCKIHSNQKGTIDIEQ